MYRSNGTKMEIREEIRREVKYLKNGKAVVVVTRFKVYNANDWCELLSRRDNEYYAQVQNKYADILGPLM